jgi:hypothetical protein
VLSYLDRIILIRPLLIESKEEENIVLFTQQTHTETAGFVEVISKIVAIHLISLISFTEIIFNPNSNSSPSPQ